MKRNQTLAATALAALMATSALAGVERVQEIDVSADVTALQNEKAAAYWATLEADLEAALALRLTDRMADDGAEIKVDIREVELNNAFERALNMGDAVLVGQVNVIDQTDHSNFNAYELTVSLQTAQVILPEGQTVVVLSADDRATYQTLIDTFADSVVERLD